jgi:hypothetical protein
VNDRIKLDDLTSNQLDTLYEQLAAADREMEQLRRDRDLAIAHDRQPYPTAWAYEQACKALHKHRDRADRAEAATARVRALHYQDGVHCAVCTEDFGRLNADWPCPTIRALDNPAPGP